MRIVTSQVMRQIDKFCIESLGIPGLVLMENASLKVVKNINLDKYDSFTIICGRGNNGGDGLAVARHLYVSGKKVEVFIIQPEMGLSPDCEANFKILKNMNLKLNFIYDDKDIKKLKESIEKSEVTVDSIFGTGLARKVEGIYMKAIEIINKGSRYIVSIDVPSGLNSDNGEVLGCCIRADKTISFQFYKKGFLKYGSENYTGEVVVEKIGMPQDIGDKFLIKDNLLSKNIIKEHIPVRGKYTHKGDFGRLSIIAGSKGFTGAAFISTQSAVRSGAGLVTLCCPCDIQDIMSNKLEEAMTVSISDRKKFEKILNKSDVIAVGPGMGNNSETFNIISYLIKNTKCPIVIDADGINVLEDNVEILKEKNNKIVLTPHIGEMSRITGLTIDEIKNNRIEIAKKFAKKYDVIVLLKGYNTVITDGENTMINTTGNSAMASGGMGDCLTGIIASFIAQGLDPFEATFTGAYIHGYCGDELSKDKFCVNASQVLENLPCMIKKLLEF